MSKITAIINQKGGVGKTTTALNLSYALSQKDRKVLLVDFDPQASLTTALNVNSEDTSPNIYSLMLQSIEEKQLDKNTIIQINDNLDLIPGSLDLAAIEMNLVNVMSRELVLKCIIEEFKDNYDYVIIDCSPSLGMLTVNALSASDSVLIPVTPEFLSARGLKYLSNSIRLIKRKLNPKLIVDGVLITMANERTKLAKEMIEHINNGAEHLLSEIGSKIKVFENIIPISIKMGEAITNKQSIIEYNPKNKVSESYIKFAEEWEDL
ncbi:MAG: chromosome partitioning protein ParA [Firmicutes bacterium HGW-Firmicutes-7]|nr:MAG: chromosome partitioning protein ParA [Firmicutes bacterium HGW-Firmicutes-7]